MVSILPSARSPLDLIGEMTGKNISQNLPGAVQQGFQRQQGLNAIDQLQADLAASGGDISKMLPALARAYTLNPNLERSGLGQSAMGFAKAGNIYGNGKAGQGNQGYQNQPGFNASQQSDQTSSETRPTPYNIMTPAQMDAKAKNDALVTGNPAQYQQSLGEQETLNTIAQNYKTNLENLASREGIPANEMPDFMEIGEQFQSENPDQWLKNTRAAYAPVKKAMDTLETAFIPQTGSALVGANRDEALKRITPDVQDLVKNGREAQARKYLASQWLSPTEIAEQIHPLGKRQEAALSRLPQGLFPSQKPNKNPSIPKNRDNSIISYKEAEKKAPKELQKMQNILSDFFLKNVDKDTSLLVLRDKLWDDKDYDWRQIGPAIREAEGKGLKLEPHQKAEMGEIDSQAPIQSLPEVFQDWWRFMQNIRGAK